MVFVWTLHLCKWLNMVFKDQVFRTNVWHNIPPDHLDQYIYGRNQSGCEKARKKSGFSIIYTLSFLDHLHFLL